MPSNPSSLDPVNRVDSERNGFAEVRRDLLTSDSASVRAAAARKLGSLRNQAGIAILIVALQDNSPEVRSAAVEALRLIGDATALGPLSDLQEREDKGSLTRPLIANAIRSITNRHYCPDSAQAVALSAAERSQERVNQGLGAELSQTREAAQRKLEQRTVRKSETRSLQTAQRKQKDDLQKDMARRSEQDEHLKEVLVNAVQAEEEASHLARLEIVRRQLKDELQQNRKTEHRLNTQIETLRADVAKQLPLLEEALRQVAALEGKKQAHEAEVAKLRAKVEAFEASVAEAEKTRQQFEARRQLEAKARREIIRTERARLKAEALTRAIEEQELNDEIEALRRTEAERLKRIEQFKAELRTHGEVVIAEVLPEPPAIVAEPAVVETDSFRFEAAQPDSQEEEIVRGNREFGISESTSPQAGTSGPAPGNLEGQDEDKALSLVTGETGLTAVTQDPSPLTEAAALLQSSDPAERCEALMDLSQLGGQESFDLIAKMFDDPSIQVRNAAARALCDLNSDRAASLTRALREANPERRRRIGAAFAGSGLASQAINCLAGESREVTYDAFTILFLMAKAGEVQPLIETIENHANIAVRLAVIKLLAFSNQADIGAAFRRLAVRASLPAEVRSALMEAIHDIGTHSRSPRVSAA